MTEVPIDKRFRGSVRLMTLLLWRLAKSTDLDEDFRAALDMGMIQPHHEAFMRKCLTLDKQLEAGEELSEPLTLEMVEELQLCIMKINSADPA